MTKAIFSIFCFTSMLLVGSLGSLYAQDCSEGEDWIQITIIPDQYSEDENNWELIDSAGNIFLEGTAEGAEICISSDLCMTFNIYDAYGDGIIQGGGGPFGGPEDAGYYVSINGEEVASGFDFANFDSYQFGNCPEGSNCQFAIAAELDDLITSPMDNSFYEFVPTESGQYQVTSCGLSNSCATAIWVYDYCVGLVVEAGPEGTIYYSNTGCDDGAVVLPILAAGETYFIRIGDYIGDDCSIEEINFTIEYLGPAVGCTDPAACNYDPIAEIPDLDACIYPGSPDCPDGPDLIILSDVLESSMQVSSLSNSDACLIEEGCISGYGQRDILRFTTHIKNIGNQDYYIGQAPSSTDVENDQWEWDPCHNHWHYEGYAEYILFDTEGQEIPIGFKNGFCVMDLECEDGGAASYGCGNQGISHHCGDIYDSSLSCQWIDLTDLDEGEYTFVCRVNWKQTPDALGRHETDYENNWAQTCINFWRSPSGAPMVDILDDCETYVDCTGTPYGSAQYDCTGVCQGEVMAGDADNNEMYTADDVWMYANSAINNDMEVSDCNDLNEDGAISVVDAALLAACLSQSAGAHSHSVTGTSHDHCTFFYVENPNDTVTLSIVDINEELGYVDIGILSPNNKTIAYQFEMRGLEISQLENIIDEPTYNADYLHNDTGSVLCISMTESTINKQLEMIPFLRVSYSAITEPFVCLDNITSIINDDYEAVIHRIQNPCVEVSAVTAVQPELAKVDTKFFPNPMTQSATLSFPNDNNETYSVSISDISGKKLRFYPEIKSNKLRISRGILNSGMYFYSIDGPKQYSGKFIVE